MPKTTAFRPKRGIWFADRLRGVPPAGTRPQDGRVLARRLALASALHGRAHTINIEVELSERP